MGLAAALVISMASAQAQVRSHVVPDTPPERVYQPAPWELDLIARQLAEPVLNQPPPPDPNDMLGSLDPSTLAKYSSGPNPLAEEAAWEQAQWDAVFRAMSGAKLGGPISLSMYSAGFAGLDFSGSSSHGVRVFDTAGIISNPNASAGYRSFDGGGGINLTIDASRLFDLPVNQRLWFGLTADFHYDDATFSTSGFPGGTNAKTASAQSNIYTVTGSADYMINDLYFRGFASFDFNHADFTNNSFVPGARGDTNGRGYTLDATVGKFFPLVNTLGLKPETLVKAPPTSPGGYALFLDASGHYAYVQEREDGFTDNTGFAYGAQQASFSDVGVRTRVIGVVPDHGFAWIPYVGATFDRELGLSSTFDIPAQAVTPADTVIFLPSTTFWGAELGLDILGRGGTKLGIKAFYEASTDTQTFGGSAFLRIPSVRGTGSDDR